MSMQDNGPGPGPGDSTRGRNPGSESDFASSQSADYAPEIWGNNALNAQKSEVTLMANGAGRPGQPAGGQRPMFGGGSPVFAQMPTYKPVTRGSDFAPQAPEPPQPAFNPYTAPSQPSQNAGSGLSYPSPQSPSPLSYPSPHPSAAPSYQSPHPTAAPSYQSSQPASAPNYHNPHAAPAPSYQASEFQPQNYHPAAQPVRAPSFSGADYAGSQSYASAGYNGAQGFPNQNFHDQNFADANFPESGQSDASFPESIFDRNFADPNYGNQNFGQQADASFPESFDGKFADASFPSTPAFEPHDHFGQGGAAGYGQPDGQADHGYENFADEHAHDYGAHGMDSGQVPPSDPRRQLQAFDAIYDQPPQIALGSTEASRRPAQDFYEGERVDADFLDEGQGVPPPNARGKMTLRSRSAFMVGSALLGAIALGGALAFAYKQSGGGLSSEQPPIVQADNSPVKELPDDPGGKDFPHKNKLIYDRLQNGDEPESERLVPRQENVAVPALPPSTETAGMPMPVATTDLATPTTQATGGEPVAVASVDNGSMPDGGPRKVKTMVVRPDGSVSGPPADATAAEAAAAPQEAAPAPEAAQAAPQQVASVQGAAPAPKPAAKPAAQQTAAVTPKPAAAPASSKYVVQVGSKKNQTDALASFADMQQKYPTLLANYRPMVQKADLGTKGTWYRLRIGPIADKTAASKLCTQLKSQGLPDCLVMAQ